LAYEFECRKKVFGRIRDENLDLLGWMAVFAKSLIELAELSGDAGAAAGYRGDAARYTARLQEHWSDDAGSFCEVGVVGFDASARVELDADGNPPYLLPGARTGAVCHVGYVALVPLLFRMLPPDDARLAALLTSMEDPAQLASPWGLRALSRSDPLYGTELSFGTDYWRSSIWINFNFLAVAALRWYADAPGPHAARCGALADGLQERVVALVVGEYNRTGFIWEHYSSEHGGHGRGTHPFTGWSALVALMVAGRYPL
jgi:mannosyl-oligosaccharide glucosidase